MRSAIGLVAAAILMGAMALGQSAPAPQASPANDAQAQADKDAAQEKTQAEKDAARAKARAEREKARAAQEKARADRERTRAELERKLADRQEWRVSQSGSYLGVDIRELTPDRVAPLKLKNDSGVEITMVDQDAPAGKAGLKEHDVIVNFNGQQVESAEQLRRLIRETPSGKSVALGIMRDGQPMTINTQLGSRQQVWSWSGTGKGTGRGVGKAMRMSPEGLMPALPAFSQAWGEFDVPQIAILQLGARNGLVVEDLTPQLGQFFAVPNGEGVLVRSVEKGSAAAEAGLKAGDVIVKINSDRVSCSSDWRRVMRQQRSGTVSVNIIRDKRPQTVSMKVPERKTSDGAIHIVIPDVNPGLENMNRELDRMAPQIERAAELAQAQAMREVERTMRDVERQLERATREMEKEQVDDESEEPEQDKAATPATPPTPPTPATPQQVTPVPPPPPPPQSF